MNAIESNHLLTRNQNLASLANGITVLSCSSQDRCRLFQGQTDLVASPPFPPHKDYVDYTPGSECLCLCADNRKQQPERVGPILMPARSGSYALRPHRGYNQIRQGLVMVRTQEPGSAYGPWPVI